MEEINENSNLSIKSISNNIDNNIIKKINTEEKIKLYEDKIKSLMINMMNISDDKLNKKFKEDLINFELFLDEEIVSKINETNKLNIHLGNIIKENNINRHKNKNNLNE